MKPWKVLLVSLAVLFAGATIAIAEEAKAPATEKPAVKPAEKPAAKPAEKTGLTGQYAEMAKECKLTPQEAATLEKAVAAKKAAVDEAKKANETKLVTADRVYSELKSKVDEATKPLKPKLEAAEKAYQDAVKKAAEERDAVRKEVADAEAKAGAADLKKARDERDAIQKIIAEAGQKGDAGIQAVFTADQKALWEGYLLGRSLLDRYRPVKFTEDQIAQVRDLANVGAKKIAADPKVAIDVRKDLRTAIEDKIMTADQKDAWAKAQEAAKKPPEPAKKAEAPKKPEEPKK